MAHQRLADAAAVDHVEYPGRHAAVGRRLEDRVGHAFGCGHVSAVCLDHHRAAGGQGGGAVAAGGGKGQREVAGTEHRHRAETDSPLAQVGARRGTPGLSTVDARAVEVATPQDFGEQPQLVGGTYPFALDACGGQRGLATDQGDEVVAQGVEARGDRLEESGAARGGQLPVVWIGAFGGAGGGVDLRLGGLDEGVGQRFAAVGVEAAQDEVAGGAASAADIVVTEDAGHGASLGTVDGMLCRWPSPAAPWGARRRGRASATSRRPAAPAGWPGPWP